VIRLLIEQLPSAPLQSVSKRERRSLATLFGRNITEAAKTMKASQYI
jgi:hypothetical protein